MGPKLIETLLTELIRFEIAAFEQSRAVAGPRSLAQAELAARREIALQETLREAIFLRNWNIAQQPLLSVAARLGISLPENGQDSNALAIEATRVLIDISEERMRRDRGEYDGPSIFFRRAAVADQGAQNHNRPCNERTSVNPASFASSQQEVTSDVGVLSVKPVQRNSIKKDATSMPSEAMVKTKFPRTIDPHRLPINDTPTTLKPRTKPPVEVKNEKFPTAPDGGNMLLSATFDLYIANKVAGYTDDFCSEEVPNSEAGNQWRKSSSNNLKVAKRIWVNLIGDRPICDIRDEDIREAKRLMMRLPETHGKSSSETSNLRALIAQTDENEKRAIQSAVTEASYTGASPAKREQAAMSAQIPRIRVETVLKHTRALNRPTKMLVKLGHLESSPFTKHMISSASEKNMRKAETKRDRRPWDDRINKFFKTPLFQGKTTTQGDPMFWAPLMALFGGARQEEILQLSPSDFETTKGIHYYRLQNGPGQSIKSCAGVRSIPVHPELIRLGLLELVALRRQEGEPRLFPELERGKTKETYSELFTKEFTKYRQKNNVYWRGLDFHALRTTVHHQLMDNGVPGYAKRRLLGHEALDEGEKSYAQHGISISTLFTAVCGLSYDLSGIRSPFEGQQLNELENVVSVNGLRVIK